MIVLGAIGLYQLGTSAGKLKEEDAYAYCQTQLSNTSKIREAPSSQPVAIPPHGWMIRHSKSRALGERATPLMAWTRSPIVAQFLSTAMEIFTQAPTWSS